MYEAFYGLTEKPFSIQPDPDFLFFSKRHSMAFTMMEYGIQNKAGFSVISGEIGCGKTTLIRHLLNRLEGELTVGLVYNTHQDIADLLEWIMLAFGQPYEGLSPVARYDAFQRFLISEYGKGKRVILIVDEAQNLSPGALESLRMLSNINADKDQLLQVILVGQPQLKALLCRPELAQFAQRVSVDYFIPPLETEEVVRYIAHRLEVAGRTAPLFTDEAMRRIAEATRGVPRSINILCDTALVYGFSGDSERIDLDIVNDVINDRATYGVFGGEVEMILPVVLSGGSGTRLWPLSREKYPKQLLPLVGEQSMLQATVARMEGIAGLSDPLIVCNEEHRFVVAEQVRLLGKRGQVLLEPVGRNTAPALTLAALLAEQGGDDPVLVVMPADHVILDVPTFQSVVVKAAALAESGCAVTFGITPDCPETGYGYIQKGTGLAGDAGAFALARFVEKPKREVAQAYLDSGEYLWNSGLFVMKASVWLAALKVCRPDILTACEQAMAAGKHDGDFVRVDKALFEACPSDSIDYAVMERLTAGQAGLPPAAVIPLSAGWSDVGAWDALWKVLDKCESGNAMRGDVLLEGCRDTLAISEGRLVACVGVSNLVVVETDDAVLVAHHDATQDVKKIVERLKADGRSVAQWHRKVYRPWGWYDGVDAGERFQVKRICVKPGGTLSLQMHHHRAEHWIVVKGTARVTRGDEAFLVSENQSTYIPLGVTHRLENPGVVPLEMIEVQSGSYLGEDDIVRFEDTYGRS